MQDDFNGKRPGGPGWLRGFCVRDAVLAVAALLVLSAFALGGAPAWWAARGVTDPARAANDFAPVNQGQLKKIATEAINALDAGLPGGAGTVLLALRANLAQRNPAVNDYAPVNLGQIKAAAKPIYDRLILGGLATGYPWANPANPADDFAFANIGQLKALFAFSLPAAPPATQPVPAVQAAAAPPPAPAPPPSISNGDFSNVTQGSWNNAISSTEYKGGGFRWAYVAANGVPAWSALVGTKIEVWKTDAGEQFIELDGSLGNHGVKQQVKDAAPGTFLLTWKHLGRKRAAAGDNGYTVMAYTTKADGSDRKDILTPPKSFPVTTQPADAISQTAWQQQAATFTVKPEDLAPPAEPARTLWIAFDSNDNNTYGSLIDDVRLLPVDIAIDANRDGTIDDSDRRKVSEAKPWSFWLNDDDDTNADALGSQRADHTTGTVDGAKDLDDFFPVFLDIQELVKALPPKANPPAESVIYKLKQANGAVSIVETNLTREAAFSYKDSAGIGYGISLQQHAASATTTQVTAAGVELSEDFLNNVKDANKGVILIEGRAATDKPLVLTVEKGGVQVAEVSLPLAIAPRILLLLHGMNSNTYTWDDLVRAAFGGGPVIFADIRDGQFAPLTPATLPSFNRLQGSFGKGGVRCFRLQFGSAEDRNTATTGLPNEDDMGHPLTTVTAKGGVDGKNEPYLTTQVLKCGDFESFDELAQEVDEAITMLLARHPGAQIVLVGHSRGGLAGRKFLEGYATKNLETYLTNRKAVVGFLTTSSLHKGSLMGRIYQWLADHPKHVYDSAGNEVMVNVSGVAVLPDYKPVNWQYWVDWRVVDFLKDPKTFGILNKASTLDVRRPVINDMSDRSQAIADINVENAVANLPASVRYGEIINSRVGLGVLTLGNLAGYSVFHSLKLPTMTTAARTYILGNEKVPGNFPGDGLVPRDSQVFTNLPGFPANGQNAVPSLYVTETDVVHTDAPSRTDDIRAQLRLIVPTWFP